jgi:hypothetical protein
MGNRKIIVRGGLGVSERRDRDVDRILDRKGVMFTIPSHSSVDTPMVIKKYGKENQTHRGNG